MYKIIKNVISSEAYKLEDILYKISKMYVEGRITEIEKDELDSMARIKAKAENSYNLQKQLDNIFARLEALEARKNEVVTDEVVEGEESTEPSEIVEPVQPAEEYKEYVQPTGAHDTYNNGDKVLFNGKKYICIMDNCVWSPDTYPAGWELVVEEVTTEDIDETLTEEKTEIREDISEDTQVEQEGE